MSNTLTRIGDSEVELYATICAALSQFGRLWAVSPPDRTVPLLDLRPSQEGFIGAIINSVMRQDRFAAAEVLNSTLWSISTADTSFAYVQFTIGEITFLLGKDSSVTIRRLRLSRDWEVIIDLTSYPAREHHIRSIREGAEIGWSEVAA
jgi:hypothetical protein